jgi:hypothetical protein
MSERYEAEARELFVNLDALAGYGDEQIARIAAALRAAERRGAERMQSRCAHRVLDAVNGYSAAHFIRQITLEEVLDVE